MRRIIRSRSLRVALLMMISSAIVITFALVVFVFRANILRTLSEAEATHMAEITASMDGAISESERNAQVLTANWASWDETYQFALHDNPDFRVNNLATDDVLGLYQFEMLIIKDMEGNDLLTAAYDYRNKAALAMPEGLTEALKPLAQRVVVQPFVANDPISTGESGLVLYDGTAYFVCAKPITDTRQQRAPVGTLMFLHVYSDSFLESMFGDDGTRFHYALSDADGASTDGSGLPAGPDRILAVSHLTDLLGQRVTRTISHPRFLYTSGARVVQATMIALCTTLLAIFALLYMLIDRVVLRGIAGLSRDVEALSPGESLDAGKYARNAETASLSRAVNGMLARLKEHQDKEARDQMSIQALQNILNSMDAYLYVTDPDTNEILFINDKMHDHFGLQGDAVGKICWQALQEGFTERCSFCPNIILNEKPDERVVWEEHNTKTGHYYRNNDRLISWTKDRRVHLQHSVDITDIKEAEAALTRRLKQQALTAELSRSFIDGGDSVECIEEALHQTGEFLGISRVTLERIDGDKIHYQYEWCNPALGIAPKCGYEMPVTEAVRGVLDAFNSRSATCVGFDQAEADQIIRDNNMECKALLLFPLFVGNTNWGVLKFEQCLDPVDPWSESDVRLGEVIAGILSGVMSRRAMEQQVKRLSALIEASPQYISFFSGNGQYEYFNPAIVHISGYSREELDNSGGGLVLTFGEAAVQKLYQETLPIIRERGVYEFEMVMRCKSGEERTLLFSAFSIKDEDGYGAIAVDITDMRRLERDLIAAKEQAEASSMAKGEFLSRMSHEMRTPMNAIIGMTNIALKSTDADRRVYCLDKINDASKHLLGVINDILDMSKIEANKFELSNHDFQLERMLRNVVNVISFRADEKRQNLLVSIDPKLPKTVSGDEQRLAQVITNLMSNAVKFTADEGRITLTVALASANDEELMVRVEVEDNGIGISKEQQSRLFRSFEQADGGIARKFGGTGLGLAISKRIVELMDGDIWIESEPGNGAKFAFVVKLWRAKAQQTGNGAMAVKKADLKVLAVDDSADAIEYAAHIMKQLGVACDTALSGDRALKLVREATRPYDMIFVDWRMPGMNGVELTREIKRAGMGDSIVIMVSVAEWNEIEDEARSAGVMAFLPKPLFPSQVADCINSYFDLENDQAYDPLKPAGHQYAGHRVLLAEDIDINREILESLLEETGIALDFAENGLEAVNRFTAQPDRYDLILMDVQMPEVDGLEATRRIRALDSREARAIPIVAMTANAFREDVEKCMDAGMNDHLAKPIDVEALFAVLDSYLLGYGKK